MTSSDQKFPNFLLYFSRRFSFTICTVAGEEPKTEPKKERRMMNAKIEAYGTKGFKNTPWRKTFKNREAMLKWVEKNDATVIGTRNAD